MKKKNVINLIKYFAEKNEMAFKDEAYEIAKEFENDGDYQLSEYIVSVLADTNSFMSQTMEKDSEFLRKVAVGVQHLSLPTEIRADIDGVINAINHKIGVNKFLFEGAPGTGKTEAAKLIAKVLNKNLYIVNFSELVDSHLGQTQKNIGKLFEDINDFVFSNKNIVLFDEIDSIAIDRINSNDVREMGRATSAMLKGLDSLRDDVVIIATTNLYNAFDKALVRRFDAVVNFNRYTREDLIDIAVMTTNRLLDKYNLNGKNSRMVRKIINLYDNIPYPAELINLIKTSIAFSGIDSEYGYLRNMFSKVYVGEGKDNPKKLQELGFSLREIEIITKISKSQLARELKGDSDEE
ncbi:MAG: AAA family ATPase [Clostridiales bacterium]|nr:AAA family ATPase [Clostridiales bacterium]